MTEITPLKVRHNFKKNNGEAALEITIPKKIVQKYNITKGDIILALDKDQELRLIFKDQYLKQANIIEKVRSVGFV